MQFVRQHLDRDAADLDLGEPGDRAGAQHVDVIGAAPHRPGRPRFHRRGVPQRSRLAHEVAVVSDAKEFVVTAIARQRGAGVGWADDGLVPTLAQRLPLVDRATALVAHRDRRLRRVVVVAAAEGVDRLATARRVGVHTGLGKRRTGQLGRAALGAELGHGGLDVDGRGRFAQQDRRGDGRAGDHDEDAGGDERPAAPAPAGCFRGLSVGQVDAVIL